MLIKKQNKADGKGETLISNIAYVQTKQIQTYIRIK